MSNIKNRRGMFRVSFEALHRNFDGMAFVLRQFAVVSADSKFDRQEIEYVAHSEMFDEVPPGEKAPEYIIETSRNIDGNISKVSAHRTEYNGYEFTFGASCGKTTVPMRALIDAWREKQKAKS